MRSFYKKGGPFGPPGDRGIPRIWIKSYLPRGPLPRPPPEGLPVVLGQLPPLPWLLLMVCWVLGDAQVARISIWTGPGTAPNRNARGCPTNPEASKALCKGAWESATEQTRQRFPIRTHKSARTTQLDDVVQNRCRHGVISSVLLETKDEGRITCSTPWRSDIHRVRHDGKAEPLDADEHCEGRPGAAKAGMAS